MIGAVIAKLSDILARKEGIEAHPQPQLDRGLAVIVTLTRS
jgi:hypothetical protein